MAVCNFSQSEDATGSEIDRLCDWTVVSLMTTNFTNTADPLIDGTYLPHGGGIKTDRRRTYLLDTLSKNGIVPIRVNKKYTFKRTGELLSST
jgi:hypothetical protein